MFLWIGNKILPQCVMPPSKVGERSSIQKNTRSARLREGLLFFLFFSYIFQTPKRPFFSTIVASENIAIVLYLPCSRQRTSYVEDRTIDVRTFPFPWDIWFDIFVFGLLSSWVLSWEDSFSVVYIYRAAVTKITFGLVTTDYMRYFCEIKSVNLIWRSDILTFQIGYAIRKTFFLPSKS